MKVKKYLVPGVLQGGILHFRAFQRTVHAVV